MPRPTPTAWFFLCLLGIIWGGSFLAVEFALEGFGPLTIAAIRIGLAAIILTTVSFVLGQGLPDTGTSEGRRTWLHCLGMALFSNAIPFSLLGWGQKFVTSGFAGITMAIVPLLVLPLAHLLVPGERMTTRKAVGFVVGFVGVVLLIGPGSVLSSTNAEAEQMARFACIAASCCYACGSIITRLSPPVPLLAFSSAALILASVVLIPVALIVEGVPSAPWSEAIYAVAYLGLLPTAFATILLVYIIKTAGPSFMSLVNYQVPVWAVLFGMIFLGETLPVQFLAALALILVGLGISQARGIRFRP
jgi:drug/metabolite transporter (DMT)-like permease